MQCPKCESENPEDSNFCSKCGSNIIAEIECQNCGALHPPDSNFCNRCGTSFKLEKEISDQIIESVTLSPPIPAEKPIPDASLMAGERKNVTVLFSDLSGYTAMFEQLDPEEIKEITIHIFGEISRVISKYDGFIEKYAGDAVMAVFGVPKGHEDDPIRAINTAIEIHALIEGFSSKLHEKIGRSLTMHTGINSGLVITGEVNIEKGTHGLTGDAINLASRLESLAKAGEILVGHETFRQVERYFIFEPLEPTKVKGKAEPVQTYRVVRQRAELEQLSGLAIQGISSQLIGRDTEFEIITGCVKGLLQGRGGIVSIIGEAGLGKSRLMAEVYNHVVKVQGRSSLQWLEGRTLSYGQSISYWPFQEILWSYTGITENDGEAEAWGKLERSVSALYDEDTGEILPYLACLLTLEVKGEYAEDVKYLDGEAMGRQVFRAMRRFFERLSKAQPVVLVFEDLHWMDESSGLLLEHLLPLVQRVPLLICLVGRPNPETPAAKLPEITRQDYGDRYTEIRLTPLSKANSVELINNLLEIRNLPAHVNRMILQKAEGNPFFLEEIIRSLIDSGAVVLDHLSSRWRATEQMEAVTIPDTIQGVIIARVDQLDEDVKCVLRSASVIGRSFLYRVLRAVEAARRGMDEHLSELQKIQLIRERQKIPELEYIFKHALAQEAIYESILLQKRKELHCRIGQVIETLFPERLEEYYGLLAYHYARAEDWQKAQEYLFKAGDRAGQIAADAEALEHYQNALKAYGHVFGDKWEPLQRASLERKIGEALFRQGEHQRASEYLERALSYLSKPFPNSPWGVRLAILHEILSQIGHRLIPGLYPKKSDKPIRPEVEEEVRIYESIGWVEIFTNPERFLLLGLRMLNFCERTGHLLGAVIGYSGLEMVTIFLSLPRIASKYGRLSVELAELIRHPGALGIAYQCLAVCDWYLCKSDKCIEHARRGAEAYRKGGYWNPRGWGVSMMVVIRGHLYKGDFKPALSNAQELIHFGEDTNDKQILCWGSLAKGRIQQCLGRFEESIINLNKAIELAEAVPDYMYLIEAWGELGRSFLKKGELNPAFSALEEGRRLSIEIKMKGHCNTPLIKGFAEAYLLAAEQNDRDARAEWLRKAKRACHGSLKQSKTDRSSMPESMRFKGTFKWLNRNFSTAQRWWQRSLLFAEEKGLRYYEAKTHLEMGRWLKDQAHLDCAEAIFKEIGADWDLARTREVLVQFH